MKSCLKIIPPTAVSLLVLGCQSSPRAMSDGQKSGSPADAISTASAISPADAISTVEATVTPQEISPVDGTSLVDAVSSVDPALTADAGSPAQTMSQSDDGWAFPVARTATLWVNGLACPF